MASPAAGNAVGSTITFSSGFFAQITDIQWSGIKRNAIETTHFGTALAGANKFGNRTFIVSKLNDPGELKVKFNFNPDTLPPIEGAAETVTVSVAGSATPATWAGSGFMTDLEVSMPMDGVMEATATLKFSGNVTRTAGT